MKLDFTDNIAKKLLDSLSPQLYTAKELKFGVAFVKYSGFRLIEEALKQCLQNDGKAEFIVGLDFRTTEPKVLRILNDMAKNSSNTKLFCFSDPSIKNTPVYHPKIYIIKGVERVVISIGSSNLTAGGLKSNVEINTIIEANINEEIVSDIYGIYNRLKFQKARFEPDADYIEEYEKVYKIIQGKNAETFKEKHIKGKITGLIQREKILPKPTPLKSELFGWQKIVYERLPEGIFETNSMYDFENEFKNFYPENNHVKDKVRQILQQLRDIRLLKYLGNKKWSKF